MRRHFFDQREGDEMIPDEQGIDLVSLEAMQHEATFALAHLAKDEARRCIIDAPARRLAINVRDEDGPVLRATFTFEIRRFQ
ncbi:MULTISPECIES: DUF6894 family protein [Bradyrhizobium]|jgi:uncharacterized protein DUF6894|uniref:DUF6894 family protein n=1 Tax=Bradyrhizobium TaxID=374 RepID=UPI000488E434|nr:MULTISPECIES: hypothetical protein [Bradyrhizobium]MCS3453620.1 hypothetical protein [Bradyrhizobium elkanii]MCS3564273.1 hypothetical protein [Bradyrhizobium elkanii]MCW2145895.1 hypothetical protein [Bradyrhizobium elkanii]MCW2355032.1 hypothetical protein [Bradyrhizobium elkanii]MCW2378722.1 hypothetical protein [Bradyrhizobium elkanii]